MDDKKYSKIEVELKKTKLHFTYVVLILLLTIIGIISFHWCENRDTFNAVSFSSALISIILAVLTIVYSYYLNSKSSGQIDTLNQAAKDVSEATKSYADSADNLHNNINKIIEAVDRIEGKTDTIINDSLRNGESTQNNISNFDPIEYAKNYVLLSSVIGKTTIYACILSKKNSKSFTLDLIGDDKTQMYAAGFLISTFATGLVSGDIDFNKLAVTANNIITTVEETTTNWVNENLENEYVKDLKPIIDKYFE